MGISKDILELSPLSEVIEDIAKGKLVVVVDDVDRENEGDLTLAGEKVTTEAINFMLQYGKGLICLSLTADVLDSLKLPLQVSENKSPFGTNFAVSFSLRGQGQAAVSAQARAKAIYEASRGELGAEEYVAPGFVFPLRAEEGGVFSRRGQTEASVDLARLAGLKPAGVICEIMGEDGQMLRGERLMEFCKEHDLKITSVEAIVRYRAENETGLRRVSECELEEFSSLRLFSQGGTLESKIKQLERKQTRAIVYRDDADGREQWLLL